MNITIKAEFLAGTNIGAAFKEAIRVSKILNCTVEFKFNDVTCWGVPNGSAETG